MEVSEAIDSNLLCVATHLHVAVCRRETGVDAGAKRFVLEPDLDEGDSSGLRFARAQTRSHLKKTVDVAGSTEVLLSQYVSFHRPPV